MENTPLKTPLKKVIVIGGPTNSGKTSFGISLARRFGGIVISADSRQIYKLADIGTGKLPIAPDFNYTRADGHWIIEGTPVYGYDLILPDERFSAADFARYARDLVENTSAENIFIVGGTGFYLNVLLGGVSLDGVGVDPQVREEVSKLSPEDLLDRLGTLQPEQASSLDPHNIRRMRRALEKALTRDPSGTVETPVLFSYIPVGAVMRVLISPPRDELYRKIDLWADHVWRHGLLEETAQLVEMGYSETELVNGVIYKTAKNFLSDGGDELDAIKRIQYDLHAYIRRQQTYFKRMKFDVVLENCQTGAKNLETVYNFLS